MRIEYQSSFFIHSFKKNVGLYVIIILCKAGVYNGNY